MVKRAIDGIHLEFENETQASVIEKMVSDAKAGAKTAQDAAAVATKRATDAETALEALKAENAKLVTDHAARVKELEAKAFTPAQRDALVAEKTKVIADGIKLMPDLKSEGKTSDQIRVEVLTHVVAAEDGALANVAKAALGGLEPGKADAARASVAFDAVVATAATLQVEDEEPAQAARARDAALSTALAGSRKKTKAVVGRAAWMQGLQGSAK